MVTTVSFLFARQWDQMHVVRMPSTTVCYRIELAAWIIDFNGSLF